MTLVKDIKETGLGITINNEIVATLLYADDIVILAENCEEYTKSDKCNSLLVC